MAKTKKRQYWTSAQLGAPGQILFAIPLRSRRDAMDEHAAVLSPSCLVELVEVRKKKSGTVWVLERLHPQGRWEVVRVEDDASEVRRLEKFLSHDLLMYRFVPCVWRFVA